jgi:mRNA-degrading endonuclease RelE of RelBE toxin-antitoxin system
MQTVISTPEFLSQAKKHGLSPSEVDVIVEYLATDPLAGEVMVGTSGARKLRHAGKGRGKSGGYRTIHYFGGDDIPVFLLTVYGKGASANLTKAERNALAKILPIIGDAYRETSKKLASLAAKSKPKGMKQ